jgi:hypothetical protein
MKKACPICSFLGKIYIRQNAVLTMEKADETGARLEYVPCKSLTQLIQQAEVSMTTVWRVTIKLHLLPYKVRQVQVNEEGDYQRQTYFCNWILQSVHGSVLGPKPTFLTDEVWFHLSGCISVQNNKYWGSINPRQIFKVPLHD